MKRSYANLWSPWMANAAMMPFKLVLLKNDDFSFNLHVKRQEMTECSRSVAQRIFDVKVEAEVPHVGDTRTVHRCGRGPTRGCVLARCVLEAVYQRPNELTKRRIKMLAERCENTSMEGTLKSKQLSQRT
eukprot:6190333-Pleurochrysis_carterae.AAC.1